MFKIHTNDGLTTRLDLEDHKQAEEWIKRLKDPCFQSSVTGISIVRNCNSKSRCPNCGKKLKDIRCSSCQNTISELECGTGIQYSVSRPMEFAKVFYLAERIPPDADKKSRGGERIVCFADGVKISMMVHAGQSAARIFLTKTGKQRYNPYMD